ncbi:MAG: FAD-dependent oxidoreductase [Puniceicoccaceae bacterium]|nr:MAG: FAD-dependent oxidoreductase [Puniceicoccaceae bacterium]
MSDFHKYDVLVAGGGTAGTAAAISAARRGHRVLLVEEMNCLGGVSTGGGVAEWFASLGGMGNVFDETLGKMARFGARYANNRWFNPEYLKGVWQLNAEAAGVDILFHASVMRVRTEADRLVAAEITCCSQTLDVRADWFIDTSGEGDLCALAGAAFQQGDAKGRVLHMSLTAWMYDTGEKQTLWLPDELEPIDSADELPGLGSGWKVSDNRIYLNATKVLNQDPTDPFQLSAAEREARRQLLRIAHYVQRFEYPTYALASSGARIGIREGRRVTGDFVLTKELVLNRDAALDFEDGVAVATCQIDFHSLSKAGNSGWRQRLEPYSIPFRCMVSKDFSNLMMAGKCISVDQVVHSSSRMTPTCCSMGQAVGTAAALAVEQGAGNIREVSIESLRATLAADGMELDPSKHHAFAPDQSDFDEDEENAS